MQSSSTKTTVTYLFERHSVKNRDRRQHFSAIICLQGYPHSNRELFCKVPATERNQRDVTSFSTMMQQ